MTSLQIANYTKFNFLEGARAVAGKNKFCLEWVYG